jgi:hypothetical protein
MPERRPGTDPSNRDITHAMLARTGFSSIPEMAANIMFATKKPLNPLSKKKPFRPGVPAKLKDFDNREIDGEIRECIILEYMNGLDGETLEYAHPLDTMCSELEFISVSKCTATYIKKDRLERGL